MWLAVVIGVAAYKLLGRDRTSVASSKKGEPDTRTSVSQALSLTVIWVVLFTYSEDFVTAFEDANGEFPDWPVAAQVFFVSDVHEWRIVALSVDVVLIAVSLLFKWLLARAERDRDWGWWTRWGWWTSGACLVVTTHVMVIRSDTGGGHRVDIELFATALFAIAMALLLISTLNGDPWTLVPFSKRGGQGPGYARAHSVLPLIIGTFVAFSASTLWFPDLGRGCSKIEMEYFAQMAQVLPLILITLGLQMHYFGHVAIAGAISRVDRAPTDPVERAAPIVTALLLCIAEVLAFSYLAKPSATTCTQGGRWHEYVAFVVTAQGCAVGLATIVWLLLTGRRRERRHQEWL